MLSEKQRNNITASVKKIEMGQFDFDTICSLFVQLRDVLVKKKKKGFEVLYDIFHSTAHSNRDRGIIFEYSKNIVNSFTKSIKSGGSVSVNPLNPNFYDAFKTIFRLLSIRFDRVLFKKQIPQIEDLVYNNILIGANLDLKNNEVEHCCIVKGPDNHLYIEFKMKPFDYTHPSGLTINGNPNMRFRLK